MGENSEMQTGGQEELFDATEFPAGFELLLPAEKAKKLFTAERVARNESRYAAILSAIAEGMGIRRICRAFRVSPSTVYTIQSRSRGEVETEKKELAAKWSMFAHMSVERLIEEMDKIPMAQMGLVAGIAATKVAELRGDPTLIIEHRQAANPEELRAWLAERLQEKQANVIEIQPGTDSESDGKRSISQ